MKFPKLALAALLLAPLSLPAQEASRAQDTPHSGDHAMPAKAPVPPSKSLIVVFQGRTTVLSVEDLLKLPQVSVHVHNAHRNTDEEYSGPLVSDVLAKAGVTVSPETQPLILHSAVVATGTDNYYVLYSLPEMEPAFSNSKVIVAIMKTGLPNTEGGLIELVNTDGAKPARWVHGLMSLNVMSMNPTK